MIVISLLNLSVSVARSLMMMMMRMMICAFNLSLIDTQMVYCSIEVMLCCAEIHTLISF